jgi:orotate phosphoribosyltransferase
MEDKIIRFLFSTDAIRVSDPEKPFWYASGTLGPFYINTHFLLSNELEANELLTIIESSSSSDRITFPKLLLNHLLMIYERSESFRTVTDLIVAEASKLTFDYISGGERRDFFFSMLPAYFLGKPHLSIFKDFQAVYSTDLFENSIHAPEADLAGLKALHIADLVTEASSYTRVWIPVIENLDSTITDTIAVVDRKQGGSENLGAEGVKLHTLTSIDPEMFLMAMNSGLINSKQYKMIIDFMKSPTDYMKSFIADHPNFLSDQISLGGKAKERAELAISKGYGSLPGCV